MKIIIKTSKLDLTPALKEYIEMKMGALDKFLKKFEDKNEIKTEILISRSTKHHRKGNVFLAEADVKLPKKNIHAESNNEDARAAIDKIQDELHREIIKYKELRISAPVRESKLAAKQ